MANYRIFLTSEYRKALKKLGKDIASFIDQKCAAYVYPQVSAEPHYGLNIKKLRGYDPETWRYRIGKFRLFYEVREQEKTVFFTTADFRKDAY